MAAITSFHIPKGLLTITSHTVETLSGEPYVEYRLEERNEVGDFVGYRAIGSQGLVEHRLAAHLRAVYAAKPANNAWIDRQNTEACR